MHNRLGGPTEQFCDFDQIRAFPLIRGGDRWADDIHLWQCILQAD
jgi:hypothetical protein